MYSDILRHCRLITVARPASQFCLTIFLNVTPFFRRLDLHKVRPSWCVLVCSSSNSPIVFHCRGVKYVGLMKQKEKNVTLLLQMPLALDIAEGISQDLALSLFWLWVYPVHIICHMECDHQSILHQCRLTTLSHPASQCCFHFFCCRTMFLMSHHFFFSMTIFHIEFQGLCKSILI
jgi:hypothetical protein